MDHSMSSDVNYFSSCSQSTHVLSSTNCDELITQKNPPSSNPSKPPVGSKRSRKLTSDIWEHFEKKDFNGENRAACKYCKVELKTGGKSGTSSLKNHLLTCPRRNIEDIGESLKKQKQLALSVNNDGKVRSGNFTFDQDVSRRELARAIIIHEYPLSMLDHIGFRRFVSSLQPIFNMVSRNTIKEDVLKIYISKKEKMQNVFNKLKGRIAITTDLWISNQKKGYVSVTAHYIDDYWVLQRHLISFVYVPTPHTMDVLASNLLDALTSWNIETKLSTITVDNCSSNDGMLSIIVDKLTL